MKEENPPEIHDLEQENYRLKALLKSGLFVVNQFIFAANQHTWPNTETAKQWRNKVENVINE